VEPELLRLRQQRLELATGGRVRLAHHLGEERRQRQALGVLRGQRGAGQDLLEVLGEVGLAREVVGEHRAEHLAVVDRPVDGLAKGEGAGEALEEGAIPADDVELGSVERLGEHPGLGLGHLAAGVDPFEGDGLVLLQGQAVLLVLLAGALERRHGLGLGGDAGCLGQHLLPEGERLGGAALLDGGGLRLLAGGLGEHLLAEGGGLGGPLLLDGDGLRLLHVGVGQALLLLAGGLGEHLLAEGGGLGGPLLLQGGGLRLLDPDPRQALLLLALGLGEHLLLGHPRRGEAGGGLLRLLALGQADLGARLLVRGLQLRLGGDQALAGLEPGDLLAGLRGLLLDDEVLLGLGLGGDALHLLLPVGLRQGVDVLGVLLLLGDGLLDGDAAPDDVGDLLALLLQLLLLGDALQLDLALAGDRLQRPGLLHPLRLDEHVSLLDLLDDGDGALAVLGGDLRLLLVLLPEQPGALDLLLRDAHRLVLLLRLDHLDLPLLAGLGLGAAPLEVEDGLVGGEVLAPPLHALLLPELVGLEVLLHRQLGDLPDAVRIHDVVLVQLRERGLLQVVDGGVVQHVAVEVLADDLDDLVLELVALRVELAEIEALAHGLERLGELGDEELLQRPLVRRPLAPDGLGHLEHVLVLLVHPDEEIDADVRPDVVLADEPVLPAPGDLDGLHRDIHDLRAVDDRVHHGPREGHVRLGLHRVHDERLALIHLLVKPGHDHQDPQDNQPKDPHRDRHDDDLISHHPCSLRAPRAPSFSSSPSAVSRGGCFSPAAATRARGAAPSAWSSRSTT
jgi:hypothetical protein